MHDFLISTATRTNKKKKKAKNKHKLQQSNFRNEHWRLNEETLTGHKSLMLSSFVELIKGQLV